MTIAELIAKQEKTETPMSVYDRTLYRQVEKAFANARFTYAGGNDVSGYESTSAYPHRYQYSQEYLISMDLED